MARKQYRKRCSSGPGYSYGLVSRSFARLICHPSRIRLVRTCATLIPAAFAAHTFSIHIHTYERPMCMCIRTCTSEYSRSWKAAGKGYNAFEAPNGTEGRTVEQPEKRMNRATLDGGGGWWPMVVERFAAQQCFAATMRKQMIPLYRP